MQSTRRTLHMSLFYSFIGRGNFCGVYPANQCVLIVSAESLEVQIDAARMNCHPEGVACHPERKRRISGANRCSWLATLPGNKVSTEQLCLRGITTHTLTGSQPFLVPGVSPRSPDTAASNTAA